MHVFHPSQNPNVKTGEKEIIQDLLAWAYSKSFWHSPSIKRSIEACIIIITFKIQSAKVILHIEGQVYGQWILSLIYCQSLIREFVSTFLFIKNSSHCKR